MLGDRTDQPRLTEDLAGSQVPVVGLWQGTRSQRLPTISVDNRWGTARAVERLLGWGHRRIAFVGGRPLGDIQERQAGWEERIRAAGLALPEGYLQQVPNAPAGNTARPSGRSPTPLLASAHRGGGHPTLDSRREPLTLRAS